MELEKLENRLPEENHDLGPGEECFRQSSGLAAA